MERNLEDSLLIGAPLFASILCLLFGIFFSLILMNFLHVHCLLVLLLSFISIFNGALVGVFTYNVGKVIVHRYRGMTRWESE